MIDQGAATLFAAFAATASILFGWIISARMEKSRFRNEASYEYLLDAPDNKKIYDFYRDNISNRIENIGSSSGADLLTSKEGMSAFCSHFEYMAVSIKFRLVSEGFAYLAEKNIITTAYRASSLTISKWRKNGHQTVCQNFEILAFRFYFDATPIEQNIIELLTGLKLFGMTYYYRCAFLFYCSLCRKESIRQYHEGDWAPLLLLHGDFRFIIILLRSFLLLIILAKI